jgi:hypothetical protein
MTAHAISVPDQLPILSRGKHRNPRKGACFMEMASYLAGERWSDHPVCTHPLLATVARDVNDATSDEARARLAVLIPSVIGLAGDDLHIDVRIALRCAREALPVASAERQRVLAVGVLTSERMLDHLDGRPTGSLEPDSRAALDGVPQARAWARRFGREEQPLPKPYRRRAAPTIVRCAVSGIAESTAAGIDHRLYDLLAGAIEECAAVVGVGGDRSAAVRPAAHWTVEA